MFCVYWDVYVDSKRPHTLNIWNSIVQIQTVLRNIAIYFLYHIDWMAENIYNSLL